MEANPPQSPPTPPPRDRAWPPLTEAEHAGRQGVAQHLGHGDAPGAQQQQQHEAEEQAQLGSEHQDGQRREPDEAGPALPQPGRQRQQHCGHRGQRAL